MNAIQILSESGLSKTRNRVNILNTLSRAATPLSGKDICNALNEKCDKSTVHRTLNSLFEKEILQRVIIDHEVKYALKNKHSSENGRGSDHIHFKCSHCDKIFCLTELEVSDFKLPDGFVKEENQFLIIGRCKECQ